MNNTATVIIGGDATKFESIVERSKKTARDFTAEVEKQAMKSALAMENAVRASKLKTQAAEANASGDTAKAAAIEREIALQSELATIRRSGGSEEQKKALSLEAIKRKELADEQALLATQKARRAELDAINNAAKASAMERQKMLNSMSIVTAPGAGPGAKGGKGNFAIGGAAMQLQDIAVQLQMGTSLATIVAQQGSQLASAFGTKGAIFGGAIAIGGALVTMGLNANKAFTELVDGADQADAALQRLTKTGGPAEISAGIAAAAKEMDLLAKSSKEFGNFTGIAGGSMGALFGGASKAEKESAMLAKQGEIYWSKVHATDRLIQLSDEEVQLQRLKTEGMDREVAAMERKNALARRLAEIDAMDINREAKLQLKTDAENLSSLKGEAENKKFDEERAQRAQAVIDSIDADLQAGEKRRSESAKKAVAELTDSIDADLDKIEKRRDKATKDAVDRAKKEGDERKSASDEMVAAQTALATAQEKRLTLTERIANAGRRVLEAEQQIKQLQGTGSGEYKAQAALARARGELQELALERASQFVGRSSKDVRQMDRAKADEAKEFEKAKRRSVEATVREADAAARRNGTGLSDQEKDRIRARERKAQGQDLKENAQAEAAKSLKTIETNLVKLADTLAVA